MGPHSLIFLSEEYLQVDAPSRVVENPNSEAARRGQNKKLEVENTTKMSNAHNSSSTSKSGLYNSNPAVILRGLAEPNSDVASE